MRYIFAFAIFFTESNGHRLVSISTQYSLATPDKCETAHYIDWLTQLANSYPIHPMFRAPAGCRTSVYNYS
ncbi:hypothetical protein V8F44DRAFT_601187 [Aspergillus fumigatus]